MVLDDDDFLQLDDLVVVRTQVPKAGEVRTYGVVTEAEAVYEGASYESDTHRIAELGIMPAAKVRSAQVQVTRVDPEVWVSPDPGETVERATGDEREKALYVDEMSRPLAVGIGRDELPVHVDLDFFDGRKGGHMSISGISGVATKTSFALFFLRMLSAREHAGIVGEGAANMRVLVFNVKGEDLLWLDRPNARFDDEAREGWAALGVEPAPFPSVAFWAPPEAPLGRRGGARHRRASRRHRGLLVDAARVHRRRPAAVLLHRRQRRQEPAPLHPGARAVTAQAVRGERRGPAGRGRVARPVADPGRALGRAGGRRRPRRADHRGPRVARDRARGLPRARRRQRARPRLDRARDAEHGLGVHAAAARRGSSRLGHLVRAGESRRIDRGAATVTVVAIQSLHEQAQRFVVGALLNETFREKEETGQRLPLSVIVLDELNKYAPREGTGPLKDMLIDIAQRGRSLGVLLVGAQQTASRVASEVLENAAIRVSGRLDAAEAERAEYGWMLPSTRARARLLKPGTMVISQPAIPVPLVVTFPFPPWATRKEEVDEAAGADPFAGL